MSTDARPQSTAPAPGGLAGLVQAWPTVLVFVPNNNELQRFVLSGAFDGLARDHRLHFALPASDARAMVEAAGGRIPDGQWSGVEVPAERFTAWTDVFHTGCVTYAHLSPSFAIRAGLEVDPHWRRAWGVDDARSREVDRAFDAAVAERLGGLEPLAEIVELFDRLRPVYCVVPTSLLDVFCNEVVWACEAENVACVLLQSGWDNMSSKGLLSRRTPFAGVWGPQSLEHAVAIQRLASKRMATLGAPHYEFLRPAAPDDVTSLRERLGVGAGERLVLFGGSFRQFDETRTLERLDRAIARGALGPCRIVYRPHPWRAARRHEENFFGRAWHHVVFDPDMQERYEREQAEGGYLKRHTPMFDMAYLSTLLSASDAVISPMSTLLLEALILRKPTMAIAFGDGKHRYTPDVTARTTHCAELVGSSALIWCDSAERMVKDCARLLRFEWDDKRERARTAVLDRVVTREPGTYAERLAEFCRTRVERHARKWRAQRTGVKRETISHAYGAQLIARRYCEIHEPTPAVPGYWMHGWLPAYHNVDPLFIAQHKREGQGEGYDFEAQIRDDRAREVQWVGRQDQAEYLRAHGYRHVRAIGLPIVYVPAPRVRRVPGSLLVMPPHGHRTHGPDDPVAERYADAIAGIRSRFAHVWVGLNEGDVATQQWIESFRRRGIDVFTTADLGDPDTLVRLRLILSTFEFVTTNGFGSHIALAAYCGARVSVWGPYADFPVERMKITHAVKAFPHLLDQALELVSEAALRAHYPFLFVEPDGAAERRDWGAVEVGEPWRVPPADLRDLFAWTTPAPVEAGMP